MCKYYSSLYSSTVRLDTKLCLNACLLGEKIYGVLSSLGLKHYLSFVDRRKFLIGESFSKVGDLEFTERVRLSICFYFNTDLN